MQSIHALLCLGSWSVQGLITNKDMKETMAYPSSWWKLGRMRFSWWLLFFPCSCSIRCTSLLPNCPLLSPLSQSIVLTKNLQRYPWPTTYPPHTHTRPMKTHTCLVQVQVLCGSGMGWPLDTQTNITKYTALPVGASNSHICEPWEWVKAGTEPSHGRKLTYRTWVNTLLSSTF